MIEQEGGNGLASVGEDRFRSAFAHAAVGVAVTDVEGRFLEANPAYCQITGYSEDELRGTDFPTLTHPDDRPANMLLIRKLLEDDGPGFVTEKRYIRKDGGEVWVKASVSLERDGRGPARIVALTEDITERKRAEARLRESEERTRLLLDSTGEAIYGIDLAGDCTFCNPACVRLLGYDRPEDLLGRNMHEVIHHSRPDGSPYPVEECRVFRAFRRGEGTHVDDEVLWRADGSSFPAEYRSYPIRKAGELIGSVVTFVDISDRKRAEATIAEQIRLALFGRDVGLALTGGGTLTEMLKSCAEATVRHLDAAFARVWTANPAGDVLELRASAGLYTHVDGPHARVPVGRFKIGLIAEERKPHLTNSVLGDPRVPEQAWAEREGMVAFAGYPLVVEDRLVGVLAMFARHELSDATIAMMASVADEIAIGIERKRAAEALAESEAWLSTTLTSIGDAVIATDERGAVRFMNPVAERLTGWPRAEAAGRPIQEVFRIINERTRRDAEHPVLKVIREGAIVGLDNHTVVVSRDGFETPIEDSAAPIRGESGDLAGVVMVFRDVTREHAARETLRASEERLRFTLDATNVGQWDLDLATDTSIRSLRHDRIFGYEEPVPAWGYRTFLDGHVHPDDRERVDRSFRVATGGARDWECECRIVRTDGAERWIWIKAGISVTEDGRPRRMLGLILDITDRKGIEEELRAAKEEAESANRAKTQFLAVLSHELRTPLNPILLATTAMLERPSEPEELRPTLEMIRQNVTLQARLIDDLLDVMRIVRGKMPLHWEVADCHKLIERSVDVCRSEVFGHELKLTLELNARHRFVNADPARLQQVFWNLIKNAVKFTPEGGSVSVRTRNQGEDGDSEEHLVIEISDSGIGIEPDVLPKVFDPFQQGETTITRKFGGLGLGLAICKGVVDAHGGSISAESAGRGSGTTFRVSLKALPEPQADAETEPAAAPDSAGSRPQSLRILAVEDEPATLRLMSRLLRGLGHTVTSAGSIAEASASARSASFDLIISDIGLPDGTGLELMRRVVALRGAVPAIALTGYGMEEDIRRSREAGFTAHMTKPIDFTKLEAMIRQVAPTSP